MSLTGYYDTPRPVGVSLFLPFDGSRALLAHRSVLVSWCHANDLPVEDMPAGYSITIADGLITYTRMVPDPPGFRPGDRNTRPKVTAQAPLLVAPYGLITDPEALTCGHVHVSLSPVADAPFVVHVCDQQVSPRDGTHPGDHRGDRVGAESPALAFRMSWMNEHPGDQAYRDGRPDLTSTPPADAHALVMRLLTDKGWRQPGLNRPGLCLAGGPHAEGLARLADRHMPRDTRHAGIVCDHDFVSATGLTPWPCDEYRDALAGVVYLPPAATR